MIGRVPDASPVHATVTLRPPDPSALASYATAVSTPGNPLYKRYLTPGEFAVTFGPAPAQIAAVRDVLARDHLDPGAVSANGLAIEVEVTA